MDPGCVTSTERHNRGITSIATLAVMAVVAEDPVCAPARVPTARVVVQMGIAITENRVVRGFGTASAGTILNVLDRSYVG